MKRKQQLEVRALALQLAYEIYATQGVELFKYAETIYNYLIGLQINSITNENPSIKEEIE